MLQQFVNDELLLCLAVASPARPPRHTFAWALGFPAGTVPTIPSYARINNVLVVVYALGFAAASACACRGFKLLMRAVASRPYILCSRRTGNSGASVTRARAHHQFRTGVCRPGDGPRNCFGWFTPQTSQSWLETGRLHALVATTVALLVPPRATIYNITLLHRPQAQRIQFGFHSIRRMQQIAEHIRLLNIHCSTGSCGHQASA